MYIVLCFCGGLNVISGVNDFLISDKKSLNVRSCPRSHGDLIKDIAVLGAVDIQGLFVIKFQEMQCWCLAHERIITDYGSLYQNPAT